MQAQLNGMEQLLSPLPSSPLVSVIMTLFNSDATLEASVRSLLGQTYRNIEVILSDDGSSDGTLDIARRLCEEDPRVTLVRFGGNHGTYWAKNFGLVHSRGEVVTFADSDDLNDERRLELQLEALRTPGAAVSTCAYSRVDVHGADLPVPGSRGFAFITQMIRRDVLNLIGLFDSVRTSADDEMLNRILIAFGADSHVIVSRRLYTALIRDGSLSHNKDNPRYSPVTRGLSPARKAYADGFRAWHAEVLSAGSLPYMPFPLVVRPFEVDPKLRVREGEGERNFVSVIAYGSASGQQQALDELGQQCQRATTCRRSWNESPGLSGEGWKVHHVSGPEEAAGLARNHSVFPAGFVLFCDLGEAIAGDFIERSILEVERSGRRGPLVIDVSDGSDALPPSSHGRGGHTTGVLRGDSAGNTQMEERSGAGAGTVAGPADVRGATSTEAAAAPVAEPGPSSPSVPVRQGSGFVRALVSLGRRFFVLWSRSEQAIGLMLTVGLLVLLLGSLLQWSRVSGLGLAMILGGIGIAVLMNTRRTRLLADPAVKAASHRDISELARQLRVFRAVHLRRRPMVEVRNELSATAPEAVSVEPVAAAPVEDVAFAIREVGRLTPVAGLAQLAGIEARYQLSPNLEGPIRALRAVLLAQVGRRELAETELSRLQGVKAGRSSRDWADHARELVERPELRQSQIVEMVDEIVGELQEAA